MSYGSGGESLKIAVNAGVTATLIAGPGEFRRARAPRPDAADPHQHLECQRKLELYSAVRLERLHGVRAGPGEPYGHFDRPRAVVQRVRSS